MTLEEENAKLREESKNLNESFVVISKENNELTKENDRLRACLERIRDHERINPTEVFPISHSEWGIAKSLEKYSEFVQGVVIGHRCAANIAAEGLREDSTDV